MIRTRWLAALGTSLTCLAATACGIKGPLALPKPPPGEAPTQSSTPIQPATSTATPRTP